MKRLLKLPAFRLINVVAWTMAAWLVFFQGPYLHYTDMPFKIAAPIGALRIPAVKAGEPLTIIVTRCNDDDKMHVYTSSRTLQRMDKPQEPAILLSPVPVAIEPGCTLRPSKLTTIPLDTEAGIYFLHGEADVRGLIRSAVVEWRTQPFEVKR